MQKILNWFYLCVLCLGAILIHQCASQREWSRIIDWKEFTLATLPGQAQYPDAGAIIIKDSGKMDIVGGPELKLSIFERHRIIKILNHRGEHYANIVIPYGSESEVTDIRARTISPSGEITVLDSDKIYDINLYPNFIFYSDQRAKIFTMPAIEPGAVIEYRYLVNISDYTFWHAWEFQAFDPVLCSRFTLVNPAEWTVNYHLKGIELTPVIDEGAEGFKSKYVWEVRDVPALRTEFSMPPLKEFTAHLMFAPLGINNWTDVAQWYHDLSNPRMQPDQTIKEKVTELIQNKTTEFDKLKVLYDWVHNNIRYIAVSIGIGGFQPHAAAEVYRNRYGDCKDMATLLCTMARYAGIETHPVLISTRQNSRADTVLASPFHFNHVIAYAPEIGDQGIWMDATHKGCPFGQLPWYDQGMLVLKVDQEGNGKIMTTPQLDYHNNQNQIKISGILQATGELEFKGHTYLTGAPANELRRDLRQANQYQQNQQIELYVAKRFPGVQLHDCSIQGVNPVTDTLRLNYSFDADSGALITNNQIILDLREISGFKLAQYIRSSQRQYPLSLRYPQSNSLQLDIELPAQWQLIRPARKDSLNTTFGQAVREIHCQNKHLMMTLDYCLARQRIPVTEYNDFKQFIDQLDAFILSPVIIQKSK